MSLPPATIVGEDGAIPPEQLRALVRERLGCYTPFFTVGEGVVAVPAWPRPIPPRWPPFAQAFNLAFADALKAASEVCQSLKDDCHAVLLLPEPAIRFNFFRYRVVRPLPPPLPPVAVPWPPFNILICVVIVWWMCVREAPLPQPPELPDDLPEPEEGQPIHLL